MKAFRLLALTLQHRRLCTVRDATVEYTGINNTAFRQVRTRILRNAMPQEYSESGAGIYTLLQKAPALPRILIPVEQGQIVVRNVIA